MILEKPDRSEALRYLGYGENSADEKITLLADECEADLLCAAAPKYLYRVFPLCNDGGAVRIKDSNIVFRGNDIAAHLDGCDRAVLMCATLGSGVDMLIRRLQVSDMTRAVITDSLASACIEQICDKAEKEIFNEISAAYRTWRYSPGYGDFPLETQYDLLSVLEAQKKIGLCATESNLLTPKKSVTAIIGLSDNNLSGTEKGCGACAFADRCRFRKNGGHCGT